DIEGEAIYIAKCQACHGEKGTKPGDALAGALVGGMGTLAPDKTPIKTVGSFWPHATTLFDYIRRAMPFQESKSLTSDEVYAVSAYILNLNGIVGSNDVIDAQSLPKVRMPNRDGFIPFPRNPKYLRAGPWSARIQSVCTQPDDDRTKGPLLGGICCKTLLLGENQLSNGR